MSYPGIRGAVNFINKLAYDLILKRTSTLVLAVVGGCFIAERALDNVSHRIFDRINKGKQWKDVSHIYEQLTINGNGGDEDDD
ncbi:hypothetical protein GJ496_001506 [Pomphorhynchus laevis]|nr:hypothetical protein GJ496_001506 [Pomphorhynchus laevis]